MGVFHHGARRQYALALADPITAPKQFRFGEIVPLSPPLSPPLSRTTYARTSRSSSRTRTYPEADRGLNCSECDSYGQAAVLAHKSRNDTYEHLIDNLKPYKDHFSDVKWRLLTT